MSGQDSQRLLRETMDRLLVFVRVIEESRDDDE